MINFNNVSYYYKKKQPLYKSLNVEIPHGNIYGLLGKNGAGKTTMLKLIAGLIYPKTGSISVMGHTPSDRMPELLEDIFIVPEELHVTDMSIQAYQNMYAPFYSKFDESQFNQYLNEFGVDKDQMLTGLSYGMKKKVLLSFGLATNTSLLILDEPTNGLDIPSKSQFRKILAGAITDDRTVIISTHQVRDMSTLIDPIMIIDKGQIIFKENLEQVASKLKFTLYPSMTEPKDVLYAERVPGGFIGITENLDNEETDIDIEVLFNAIVSYPETFTKLFENN